MDNSRYKEVEAIFVEVVDLPLEQREGRIQELSQDQDLIGLVRQMLEENDRACEEGFMENCVLGEPVDWDAPPELEKMPSKIQDYEILEVLGHGASGTVYLAQAPLPLERKVAIKLLNAGSGDLTSARFREEQRVLARLQNVGIAEVYAQGNTESGQPFTVLEYIDGDSITEYCEQEQLNWRQIIQLMLQCIRAVSHAHQRNIIHRDLKPSNLMVAQKAGKPNMKVIDFGTAKLTDPLRSSPHLTVESQFIGTLTYSSPEQLSGNDTPDTRTDVHALGLVLYECLEGKHPFFQEQDGLKDMIDRIMVQPLPTIDPRAAIPIREINAILAKACAKDLSDRYSSMLHFGEDLQNLLSGLPVLAMRPRPAYIALKFVRRNRVMLSAASLVFVAMAVLTGVAIDKGIQASESRNSLRDTALGLVDDVMPKLADLNGSTSVRAELTNSLRDRINDLLATHPSDQNLLYRKALILEYESDMKLSDNRTDEAEALRVEAADILRGLKRDSVDNDILADERRLLIKLGDIAKARKDWESARTRYEAAMDLLLATPGEHGSGLCWSYERLAFIAKAQKRYGDHRVLIQKRLDLALELLAEDPESPAHLHNAAMAHQLMAEARHTASEQEAALKDAYSARDMAMKLLELKPNLFSSKVMELSTNVIVMRGLYFVGNYEAGATQADHVRQLSIQLAALNPDREDSTKIALKKLTHIHNLWERFTPDRDRTLLQAEIQSLSD